MCKSELDCVSENVCVNEGVLGDVGTGEGLVAESIFEGWRGRGLKAGEYEWEGRLVVVGGEFCSAGVVVIVECRE